MTIESLSVSNVTRKRSLVKVLGTEFYLRAKLQLTCTFRTRTMNQQRNVRNCGIHETQHQGIPGIARYG